MHYVNKANLAEEHRQQERGKATGIDRVCKEEYGQGRLIPGWYAT